MSIQVGLNVVSVFKQDMQLGGSSSVVEVACQSLSYCENVSPDWPASRPMSPAAHAMIA